MQDYHATPDESSYDWQATMAHYADYIADQQRYPAPQSALRPCKNVDCPNSSLALFCSESCRQVLEHDEPESDDYYSDGEGVLLGHRQLSDAQRAIDGENLAALACGYGPQPAPAVAPAFTEAPISITLKGLVHGVDTMVTIRGTDFATVQAQVEAASQWLDTPAVQPPVVQEPAPLCPIHGVILEQQTNARGTWRSHRTPDGTWCKGK